MYLKRCLIQTSKCLLSGIIMLSQLGCNRDQPVATKLDSALETHFLLIRDGHSGSARVRLRQFMDQNGDSSGALFLMGLSYHQDQQYSKAVEWFNKGVSSQKRDIYPPIWHFLGWSTFYLGELEQSKRAFENHLELQPDEGDSLFGLGLIAIEEGELMEAQQLFVRSIQVAPKGSPVEAKATARWADVSSEFGDWQKAIALYQDALKLNPDLYEAWYRLSRVLHRTGQEEAANEALQEFVLARQRVRPEFDFQTRFPE